MYDKTHERLAKMHFGTRAAFFALVLSLGITSALANRIMTLQVVMTNVMDRAVSCTFPSGPLKPFVLNPGQTIRQEVRVPLKPGSRACGASQRVCLSFSRASHGPTI